MNLGELIKAVDSRLNKDQSGRTTRPDRINSFLNLINVKLFNIKAGLPEQYLPGQPVPAQALDVTSQISEDLAFCVVVEPVQVAGVNGITKPKDFCRMSYIGTVWSMRGRTKRRPVRVLFGNEFNTVMSSPLTGPTKRNPVAILEGDKFKVFPVGAFITIAYYRLPVTPFYDYVIAGDIPVYLPPGGVHDGTVLPSGAASRSVELEWPEALHPVILDMLTEEMSGNLKDQFHNADAWKHKMTGT